MLTVDYDRLGVRSGERVLDVGCGSGRHALEAARRGAHVVALDADEAGITQAAEWLHELGDAGDVPSPGAWLAVHGDAVRLPFDDASFDRVIAAELLEHVPADDHVLAELARVLRPGGSVAITVPRWFPERVCWILSREYHAPAVPGGHVRIYRRRQLLAKIRSAGFEVAGWAHVHALHTPYWWLRCLAGPQRDDALLTRLYHRFLVWDLMRQPWPVRRVERALDPVIGKSLVVYARRIPAANPLELPRAAEPLETDRDVA